jgi:hypothetical protein
MDSLKCKSAVNVVPAVQRAYCDVDLLSYLEALPIQISTCPSSSAPRILSTSCIPTPSALSISHNSLSASSRCLYANNNGGLFPDLGSMRSRSVLTRDGNEEVLYVTSAALLISCDLIVRAWTYMMISGWALVTQSGSGLSQSNVLANNVGPDCVSSSACPGSTRLFVAEV